MSSDVDQELRAFGLSSYEASAYTALLRAGPSEATDVARAADVPTGRVYDVLNSLVDRNLLYLHEGRPKRYEALPPHVALRNLLDQRKRDFEARYDQLTRSATELEQELARREEGSGRESAFYQVGIGETQTRDFLVDRIREAREEIEVSLELQRYDPEDDRLFNAFREALDQGVATRVLVRDADVSYILESPYNELISRTVMSHVGKRLQVRVFSEEQVPFGVIDGEKCLIGVKNPLDPEAYFALVYVWDAEFGRDLRDRFATLWARADLDVGSFFEAVDPVKALEALESGEGPEAFLRLGAEADVER